MVALVANCDGPGVFGSRGLDGGQACEGGVDAFL